MFSDLVGSTALSGRIDPEDLREVISAYQKCVAEIVQRFGGFVAKYMGVVQALPWELNKFTPPPPAIAIKGSASAASRTDGTGTVYVGLLHRGPVQRSSVLCRFRQCLWFGDRRHHRSPLLAM